MKPESKQYDPPDYAKLPVTSAEAAAYFAAHDNFTYLMSRRWPAGIVHCPLCGSGDVRFLQARQLWECKNQHPGAQFSIRVGTMLEGSRVTFSQWMLATWIIANSAQRVSSYELSRQLGVTQKSAWFLLKRIRRALKIRGISLPALSTSTSNAQLRPSRESPVG